MSERNASRTALGTAYLRAAHQLLDAPPRILEDPLAVTLLGPAAAQRISDTRGSYQTPERLLLRVRMSSCGRGSPRTASLRRFIAE